ncbi:hypothetical protein IM697_17660 [Streptomyces ferrugineus]|uniref:Uncharacterized protein n=1 Tax=Streptomyces ferrugineus TaxID=1413221 RepID=A0A7M2SUN1_9ACTN|nr:hypothetical protein [Streptomyces ferrugineus]QOV40057.1 hypothetical protein IM697_17660 [Streptomyces ferrugineus]
MGVNGPHRQSPAGRPEPREIRVDIGELVLDGFGPSVDPGRVSASFERELTRLVREHGVPLAADGAVTVDELSGLPPMPAGLSARRLGQELARAVHAGLSGRGEVTR